jgi:3-hydroxyacyl-CoA dehydrogenase
MASPRNLVSFERQREIGVITIDNPPVNALGPGVPEGILAALETARADAEVRGLVLIGAGQTFVAGADIKEFRKITSGEKERGPGLGPLLSALEDCEKPIVCAIHGSALGGGLELAMACHYRVASPTARLGQPEVKLGLIPGAGGTQRLPRLAGVAKALEMCVHGEPITAPDGLHHGIIDASVAGDLLEGAIGFLRSALAAGQPPRKTRERAERLADAASTAPLLAAARAEAKKRGRGLIAPQKAIDAIEAATALPFEAGLAAEATLFLECLYSEQSKALVHIFFAERATARIPGVAKDAAGPQIGSAAVVGAGTMGSGIAMVYANAGIPVALQEADQAALDRGMATIRKTYDSSVQKGRLTQDAADARLALVRPTLAFEGFADADIVV